MSYSFTLIMIIQVISALAIIVLVLLQQGKGADMGSSFGSGSAGSLFGASGAANFLSRTTKWAAVVFFVSTAALAWMGHRGGSAATDASLMQNFQPLDRSVPQVPGAAKGNGPASVPAVPATPNAPAGSPSTGNASSLAPAAGQATPSRSDSSVPAAPPAPAPAPAADGAK